MGNAFVFAPSLYCRRIYYIVSNVGESMKKILDLLLFIMVGFVLGLIGMAIGWVVMGVCLPV